MHQITESIDGIVTSKYRHERVYDLAKDIAAMPKDTKDLEIVIADRIKRYVHQEKLSVYSRYKLYVKDLCSFPKEKMQEKIDMIFDTKIAVHDQLSNEWEYGGKFSCKEFMKDK